LTVIVVSFFESVFADHSKDHPMAVAYFSATRSPGSVHRSAGRHYSASCLPHRKHPAMIAAAASAQGLSADAWRSSILDGIGPEVRPLLDSAASCMRESGL
jgi:hypothetical protein